MWCVADVLKQMIMTLCLYLSGLTDCGAVLGYAMKHVVCCRCAEADDPDPAAGHDQHAGALPQPAAHLLPGQ